MKVFADFHHPGLYYSLFLLFEKRLGYSVYRPIGMDWLDSGFYKIPNLCVTDQQRQDKLAETLQENAIPSYSSQPWNVVVAKNHDYSTVAPFEACAAEQRAVSFEQFKQTKFDFVIASFKDHVAPFVEMSRKYQDSAPVIVQVGNEWNLNSFGDLPIMASMKRRECLAKKILFYHQEFDVSTFASSNEPSHCQLASFVHDAYLSPEDRQITFELEKALQPEYKVWLHGKGNRDGLVHSISDIAEIMKRSRFGLHLKASEDVYGHIIHNWCAAGKPVIFRGSQYCGRLAGTLLEHLETGIDIDITGPLVCARIIKEMSGSEHERLFRNMKSRFKQIVNFERDAETTKAFLRNI